MAGGLPLQPGSSAGKPVSIPLPAASTTTRGQTRQFIALSLNPLPLRSGALHLTLTNNTALQRIIEMQAKLAANGCVTHVLDPTNLADVVTFSGTNWTLR